MEGDKTSRKEREEIIRVELRLPESVVNKIQEYQIRNKIEGNLQQTIVTALMREITAAKIIDSHKELIQKMSKLKTVLEISDMIYDIALEDDKMSSWNNISILQNACAKLLNYQTREQRLYDILEDMFTSPYKYK
jgi:hypothetical protein